MKRSKQQNPLFALPFLALLLLNFSSCKSDQKNGNGSGGESTSISMQTVLMLPDKDSLKIFEQGPAAIPAPWSGTGFPEVNDDLRFIVVGDNAGVGRDSILLKAIRQVGWLHPELVVNIGDMIEGYSDDKEKLKKEWDQIDHAVNGLTMPFYYVPGNHDLGNNTSLEVWNERRGTPYYAFMHKKALFLCMDTEDPPVAMRKEDAAIANELLPLYNKDSAAARQLMLKTMKKVADGRPDGTDNFDGSVFVQARYSDAQINFFKNVIDRYGKEAKWIFVLMHKPGWDPNPNNGNFVKIEKMLQNYKYTVFAGHTHYYKHEVRNGMDYVTMATTGALAQNGNVPGRLDHITWVTLTNEGPKVVNLKLSGILNIDAQSMQSKEVY